MWCIGIFVFVRNSQFCSKPAGVWSCAAASQKLATPSRKIKNKLVFTVFMLSSVTGPCSKYLIHSNMTDIT